MKTLCLHSIHSGQSSASNSPRSLLVASADCEETPLVFWKTIDGEIKATSPTDVRKKSPRLASLLYRESGNANPTWLMAPLSVGIMHNGIRPLPLAIIEPGDVIAFEDQTWLITELWRSTPGPAPEKIAEKECSVCGGAMKLANVLQCPCGRYYHLEHPETPDDPTALNCYLTSGMCGLCGRKPSLEPQFLPVPPEELVTRDQLELAIASV
jgi:hypothetical protein